MNRCYGALLWDRALVGRLRGVGCGRGRHWRGPRRSSARASRGRARARRRRRTHKKSLAIMNGGVHRVAIRSPRTDANGQALMRCTFRFAGRKPRARSSSILSECASSPFAFDHCSIRSTNSAVWRVLIRGWRARLVGPFFSAIDASLLQKPRQANACRGLILRPLFSGKETSAACFGKGTRFPA